VRVRRAASVAGALAYPPAPSTTSARATVGRHARAAANVFRTARSERSDTRCCADATSSAVNG
jgi:hypothetical protein